MRERCSNYGSLGVPGTFGTLVKMPTLPACARPHLPLYSPPCSPCPLLLPPYSLLCSPPSLLTPHPLGDAGSQSSVLSLWRHMSLPWDGLHTRGQEGISSSINQSVCPGHSRQALAQCQCQGRERFSLSPPSSSSGWLLFRARE